MVRRSVSRSVLVLGGATTLAGVSTASFRRATYSLDTFRCPACRTQRALQISLSTSSAWEFLIAFGLRLRTVAAGDGCAAGGFRYYSLRREAFFVILVASMDGVMPLQKISVESSAALPRIRGLAREERECVRAEGCDWEDIPSGEAHMAGKALEWLHIGVCS